MFREGAVFSCSLFFLTMNLKESLGDWYLLLIEEFRKPYMRSLKALLDREKQQGKIIYPEEKNLFTGLKLTPIDGINLVIVVQDPYIKPNQAHGIVLSTENNTYTPTLKVMKKTWKQIAFNK